MFWHCCCRRWRWHWRVILLMANRGLFWLLERVHIDDFYHVWFDVVRSVVRQV